MTLAISLVYKFLHLQNNYILWNMLFSHEKSSLGHYNDIFQIVWALLHVL
jgi:hypothetical protein